MSIVVMNPGPCTTVQDMGRPGYQTSGFGPSGAMDNVSLRKANLLLGNAPGEAAIEFCLMAPTLRFDQHAILAVTGGDFTAVAGGRQTPAGQVFFVQAGETLTIRPGKSGLYGYIAVLGGLNIAPVMGSRSTNMKCRVGGVEGRKLQKGDVLGLRYPAFIGQWGVLGRTLPPEPAAAAVTTIRVVAGPQDEAFTEGGKATFYGSEYTVTPQSDRMGLRLDGPAVETVSGSDIISDGIPMGGIQIPGNGTPIVMMADRQTTGGYAKIATVATVDLPVLAQLRPGSKVKFAAVSVCEAQKLLGEREAALRALGRSLIGPVFPKF